MTYFKKTTLLATSALVAATYFGLPNYAVAQTAPDGSTIETITVTAEKRTEDVQNVPIAITAISGKSIDASGLTDFQNLNLYSPSLLTDENGDARAARVGLRGVTSSQDPGKESSVGVFLDGVFLSRINMAFTDLLDVDHIEILRGPQGTLFGNSVDAGLVNIVTRRPDLDNFGGYIEGVIGNYDTREIRGTVTGPIVPGELGFSLAGYSDYHGGLTYNSVLNQRVDNQNRWGTRGKLEYSSGNLNILLIADYAREDSECCSNVLIHLDPGANLLGVPATSFAPPGLPYSRTTVDDTPNYNKTAGGGVSAEINWDAGWATLTSVTAYRHQNVSALNDPDDSPLAIMDNFFIDQQHSQFSQELRLASPSGNALEYVVGLYYLNADHKDYENIKFDSPFLEFPGTDGDAFINDTFRDSSEAAFGRLAYHISDALTAAFGARYTVENQHASFAEQSSNFVFFPDPAAPLTAPHTLDDKVSRNDHAFTYTATLQYEIAPDVMAFASAARGFKPGGVDLTARSNLDGFVFKPETNQDYEVGVKSTLLNDHLVLDATAFHTQYTNFQALAFNGTQFSTTNAKGFLSQGIELEATAIPVDNLTLHGAASYDDDHYTSFLNGACKVGDPAPTCDLTGKTLPQAPHFTFTGSIGYRYPLWSTSWHGTVLGEYSYRSGAYFNQALDNALYQRGYGLVNLRIGAESPSGLAVELFSTNLLDKKYVQFGFIAPLISDGYAGFVGQPRMFGLRIRQTY